MSDRLSYLLTDHTGGLGTIPVRNEKIPRHHLTPGRISATQCMQYAHRYGKTDWLEIAIPPPGLQFLDGLSRGPEMGITQANPHIW
jgi:hypothetical protein